jgi:alkylation response protein AidB-like acyl-CoA dehydrogenase
MDFRLTEQQELLLSTAREFFQQHCPTTLVQEMALDERGFPEELWRHISALGWPGLLIPTEFDGSGGSLLDVILLVEEMGRACLPSPYVQSAVVATSLLLAAGSREQQERLLPALARGERLCTLALTEESADFVKDAHIADDLMVIGRDGDGYNLMLLETNQPGIAMFPLETISGEKLFEVTFRDVPVRQEDLLGPPGQGWEVLTPVLQIGVLARCAEMVGCAQRILEICVDYAKVREQSGRPIGAFQAIQHHCADLLRNVEGARYILYNAAWKLHEGMECVADVAMAKAYASEACLWVARKGHQILGAISYCEEHPLHLFHKRIQAAGLDFGDAALHFETVAQSIGLE